MNYIAMNRLQFNVELFVLQVNVFIFSIEQDRLILNRIV